MLGASNDTGILDAFDGLADSNSRKNRIWTEAFPISASFWMAPYWS